MQLTLSVNNIMKEVRNEKNYDVALVEEWMRRCRAKRRLYFSLSRTELERRCKGQQDEENLPGRDSVEFMVFRGLYRAAYGVNIYYTFLRNFMGNL
jgi:hypothetical protein